MQISVIIPVFNRAAILGRAIDSVLAQSFPVHEIIVIDDGSDDDTPSVLERFAHENSRVISLRQENQGVSAARNMGIERATGDWVALLDSDDAWLPTKLSRQVEALKTNPDIRICHCDEIWIRNGKRVNPMKKHAKAGGNIYLNCLPLCAISPSAVVIHQDIFNEIGLFDTTFPACEDYDLWLRICARYPVLYIDELLLNKFGGHADQLSRQYPAMDRFRIRAMEKILRSGCLNDQYRQATLNELATKFTVFSQGALKRGKQGEVDSLRQQLGNLLPAG